MEKIEDKIVDMLQSQMEKKCKKYAKKAVKKALKKAVKKILVKSLPKFTAKCAAKKIPVAGLIAGGLFGAGKLLCGDWKGACMEVSSGAASTIPGVGTAASVSIDCVELLRETQSDIDAEMDRMMKNGEIED